MRRNRIIKQTDTFVVIRIPYRVWKEHSFGSLEEFEATQLPDSLMEFMISGAGPDLFHAKPDALVTSVILDEEYFDQLGPRGDTPESRVSYITAIDPFSSREAEKASSTGLNVSLYSCAVCMSGLIAPGDYPAALSHSLRDIIAEYVVGDKKDRFEAYVYGNIIPAGEYVGHTDRFISTAKAMFESGVEASYPLHAVYETRPYLSAEIMCLPIVIRELHESTTATAGELVGYVTAHRSGLLTDIAVRQRTPWATRAGMAPFSDTEAGKRLKEEIAGIFKESQLTPPELMPPRQFVRVAAALNSELSKLEHRGFIRLID